MGYLGNAYISDSCSKITSGEWKLATNITIKVADSKTFSCNEYLPSFPAISSTLSMNMFGHPSLNLSQCIPWQISIDLVFFYNKDHIAKCIEGSNQSIHPSF